MRAIGIDVGGTAIKFALVSDGEVLLRAQCPTPTGDPPALAKAAAALIRENAPDWEMLPSVLPVPETWIRKRVWSPPII